jgi:hypothetical protein
MHGRYRRQRTARQVFRLSDSSVISCPCSDMCRVTPPFQVIRLPSPMGNDVRRTPHGEFMAEIPGKSSICQSPIALCLRSAVASSRLALTCPSVRHDS